MKKLQDVWLELVYSPDDGGWYATLVTRGGLGHQVDDRVWSTRDEAEKVAYSWARIHDQQIIGQLDG